ncbi:hypothetical protein NEPAR06_1067 [Nematocida parisii]|uniref:Uncharacterized protein n=1 Tax=Nematocida parisii (strain ERTm3) TaxID=935791 RepID=I3EGF3_NEMP3|nr:uncharacterized protein NEPG_01206 [Nematocida parisii ERTm1]EIJ88300.1 hypothetical protein NEQG_01744 [Nematocida parisii ERTm3]KAI5142283.1 hypothetical protein NEPAR07_0025 [Nematocida parisii]EIJ93634.1 hypothetical protein NEPG_01206 [Nematocida parisii ERTm1]KAI5154367.1 hypothetical protein NEPAR06_1067 [Nematocida parisii]KAI5155640.1 hypothetical protein NEPAR05_0011 [Nematocida parisii]|eukprot:XP_013059034.1 hypothetical protein NEPG_01206 [Nematocida parisii ERTm1]
MNQATLHGQEAMNEGAGQTCTITIEQEPAQTDQGFNRPPINSTTEEHLTLLERVNKGIKSELTKKEKNKKINSDVWLTLAVIFACLVIIAATIALFMSLSSDFSIKISTVGI